MARAWGRSPQAYSERFITGRIYEARPDVMAVVHQSQPERRPVHGDEPKNAPIMHMCAPIGCETSQLGHSQQVRRTNLLVTSMEMGVTLPRRSVRHTVALMRGHGRHRGRRSVREVVFTSVTWRSNAEMLIKALSMGDVTYLSDGEVARSPRRAPVSRRTRLGKLVPARTGVPTFRTTGYGRRVPKNRRVKRAHAIFVTRAINQSGQMPHPRQTFKNSALSSRSRRASSTVGLELQSRTKMRRQITRSAPSVSSCRCRRAAASILSRA